MKPEEIEAAAIESGMPQTVDDAPDWKTSKPLSLRMKNATCSSVKNHTSVRSSTFGRMVMWKVQKTARARHRQSVRLCAAKRVVRWTYMT